MLASQNEWGKQICVLTRGIIYFNNFILELMERGEIV